MSQTGGIPSLDQLAANPSAAQTLDHADALAALAQLSVVHGAIITHLLSLGRTDRQQAPEEDRLIDVREAARMLGCGPTWLYRRSRKLPFAVHNGGHLRFSVQGIQRHIRNRQGRA